MIAFAELPRTVCQRQLSFLFYYAPYPRVGALSDEVHLTSVCLSCTSGLSQEQTNGRAACCR